jgi:hypothetical protein
MPTLEWKKSMDQEGFLASIIAATSSIQCAAPGLSSLKLCVSPTFFQHMFSLVNDAVFDEILAALQTAPITRVDVQFFFVSMMAPSSNTERFDRLWEVLGSIPTLTTADFSFLSRGSTVNYGQAIRNLQFLNKINIYVYPRAAMDDASLEHVSREIAAGLDGHVSLMNVRWHVLQACYPYLLPALRTMPSLRKVTIDNLYSLQAGPLEDPQVVLDLLSTTTTNARPLRLKWSYLNLSSAQAQECFCRSVRHATAKSLVLRHCHLGGGDARAAAAALTSSPLHMLQLEGLKFDKDFELNEFVETFQAGLPSMPCLEELGLNLICRRRDDDGEIRCHDEAVADVGRVALVGCTRLKVLKLTFQSYSEAMDQLLADYIQTKSKKNRLKEVIVVLQTPRTTTPVTCCPAYNSPALLESIRTSFAARPLVRFEMSEPPSPRAVNLWDGSTNPRIQMLLRMNRAGRVYLTTDPTHRRKGSQVLESAKDDLDGLYLHLRENPLLCCSYSGRS